MYLSTLLRSALSLVAGWVVLLLSHVALAAPTVSQALKLEPVQSDIQFDTPSLEEVEDCKVQPEKGESASGWTVLGPDMRPLRRFLDTNADKKVDTWCYFREGIEVYRDVDADFNGRADQYRWLGTAGTRWGVDSDEDTKIDLWKEISAEEASREVVESIRQQDTRRFNRLLLTDDELRSLGLGPQTFREIRHRLADARSLFGKLSKQQSLIGSETQWINFSSSRPGTIPSGTDQSTKDLTVYENSVALLETKGKHAQLTIGTLIRVGRTWRITDIPANLTSDQTATQSENIFFNMSMSVPNQQVSREVVNKKFEILIAQLEKMDKQMLVTIDPQKMSEMNAQRADLLEKIIVSIDDQQQRSDWIRQLADTVSAAVQSGSFPDGVDRLESLFTGLNSEKNVNRDLLAFTKFRYLSAEYGESMQKEDANFPEIQEKWLDNLKSFVRDHPGADDASEAMIQLAIANEFAGQDKIAIDWYQRIARDFPETPRARKATGATDRLKSVGKVLDLSGTTLNGAKLSLRDLRGKVVLLHYWATWCEPCKRDLEKLKKLQSKYAKQGFTLVGVSLDSDQQAVIAYIKQSRISWPQLFEKGGLDSRLADQLGIITLPTMILLDEKTKVIDRNIHVSQLDDALEKQLK